MNATEILKELHKFNSNFAQFNDELGVARGAVRKVAHRYEKSKRIAKLMAIKIQKPFTEVFPEYKN